MAGNNKKEHILQVAKAYFCKIGIHAVSMDDIAQECGISKKTLYTLFGNKSYLLTIILEQELDFFELNLETINRTSINAIDELISFFKYLNEIYSRINTVFINDLRKYYKDLYLKLRKENEQLIKLFLQTNIERGIKEGVYKNVERKENAIQIFMKILKLFFFERDQEKLRGGDEVEFLGKLLCMWFLKKVPVIQKGSELQ